SIALERRWAQIISTEAEFLMLGADAPRLARLLAGGEVIGKLLAARDRGALDGTGYGHGRCLAGRGRPTMGVSRDDEKGVRGNNCTGWYRWAVGGPRIRCVASAGVDIRRANEPLQQHIRNALLFADAGQRGSRLANEAIAATRICTVIQQQFHHAGAIAGGSGKQRTIRIGMVIKQELRGGHVAREDGECQRVY